MALLGIIIIQYLWIDRTVSEKQKLIREKVYQSVAKVDQKLSDDHLLSLAMDTLFNEGVDFHTVNGFTTDTDSFPPRNLITQRRIHEVTSDSGAVIKIELNSQLKGSKEGDRALIVGDTAHMSDFGELEVKLDNTLDTISHVFENMNDWHFVHDLTNLFARVAVELKDDLGKSRLDSSKVDELLAGEFEENGLEKPNAWKMVDDLEKETVIQPSEEMDWEYDIPIFQNDVVHPGRYHLQINASNNSSLIWAEIRSMIIMSLIFIAIIFVAFVFAIRLVIKHKKISQIKSDFINNMTHEFKTPLASISIAADSIVHPNVRNQPEQIEKYIEVIQAEKSKLNDHVERILEVASLDKDALEIPTERVSLNEIVRSSTEKLKLLLEENEVNLSIDENGNAEILGNEFYLERVFTNIIENSIKYRKSDAKIDISIANAGNDVEITIADNGIGMDKKQIDKVFDNFYRVQTGNVHDTKGFGLGLSYAKLITEKLKGSISMDGVLNKGCTVKLKFPLA